MLSVAEVISILLFVHARDYVLQHNKDLTATWQALSPADHVDLTKRAGAIAADQWRLAACMPFEVQNAAVLAFLRDAKT